MKRVQILMLIGALLIVQKAHAHGNHGEGMHEHKEVQGIKNPLQATRTNIAEGCELYKKHCVSCHGISGKGDGKDGNGLNPPPDSLTHKVFKHGGTPGEIHMIITDGVLPMPSFGKILTDKDIWKLELVVRGFKKGGHSCKNH